MISPNEGRSRISRRRQKKQKNCISPIRTRNVDAIIRSPEEQPYRSSNSQFSDRERESLRVLTPEEREREEEGRRWSVLVLPLVPGDKGALAWPCACLRNKKENKRSLLSLVVRSRLQILPFVCFLFFSCLD
jgi:hypothetical protein